MDGKETKRVLLATQLLGEPLLALYTLLPFILRKDLGATDFQVALFLMLRPLCSFFSFYWGSFLTFRPSSLKMNLIVAHLLAFVPFLFLPASSSFLFLLIAAGFYQLFCRAGTPAFMEIFKTTLPHKPRARLFSLTFALSFLESAVLGLLLGWMLDSPNLSWKFLIAVAAGSALIAIPFQMRLQAPPAAASPLPRNPLLFPWKRTFALLRERPDFARFQAAFMLGGGSLMLMMPALSLYYVDVLDVSHLEISIARFLAMGLGVCMTIFLWQRGLERLPLPRLNLFAIWGFVLFGLFLLLAPLYAPLFYVAFFLYGVAQAGSHLLWNLGSLLFAGEGESSPFTCANLLFVGLRGIVCPFLGAFLCGLIGPTAVIFGATALLGVGCLFLLKGALFAKQPQAS